MPWYPAAIHKPLRENDTQPAIAPRAVILHTAWSASSSLFGFFQNNSDLESHFYVANDGTVEQYMDTAIRADANYKANGYAISIETQDDKQIKDWTPQQLDAIVALIDWICRVHAIPRVQIARSDGAGIGWHTMWGSPSDWTPNTKSCPGANRIAQTRTVVIERVAALGRVTPPVIEKDSEMDQLFYAVGDKSTAVYLFEISLEKGLRRRYVDSDEYDIVSKTKDFHLAKITQSVFDKAKKLEGSK